MIIDIDIDNHNHDIDISNRTYLLLQSDTQARCKA